MYNASFSDAAMMKFNQERCRQNNRTTCAWCPENSKCFGNVMRAKNRVTYVDLQIAQFLRGYPDLYGPREEYGAY